MSAIDWVIVAFALLMVPVGYRQGAIVGVLSLCGFAAGAFAGSRLGPLLLSEGSESPYAPVTALLGGLLIGGMLALMLEGVGVGIRDRVLRGGVSRRVDGVGGGLVLAVLALAIAWVVGAVALNAPALKQYRDDIQRSTILSALNETFPPSGPLLNSLNRISLTPELRGPSADVEPPKKGILSDPDLQAASGSVVRILGTACGLNISGSGWVAQPEVVVTNAHVVAGVAEPRVETRDGASFPATPVAYRPRDDLAVLAVPGLPLAAIPLAPEPSRGTPGGVIGFPGGGEFTTAAARLGTTGTVKSQDSYGRGPIEREMTSFRGEVISGNSGGPVIDAKGRVLTTVFASTVGANPPEGLGVPNEVTERLLGRADEPTGTGACA
ncbi:MAG TPA: MarP family serine protease [Solirubrobacterales bacterium]|nr:MarP family serine protease [Solirubrobacterales bacterium]